jgi:hypothetical protein
LINKAIHGTFDVYSYRGGWYAIPTCDETFDPDKVKAGFYSPCLRGNSRVDLDRTIRRHQRCKGVQRALNAGNKLSQKLWRGSLELVGFRFDLPFDPEGAVPQTVLQGVRGHNIVHYRSAFFGVPWSLGPFDPALAELDDNGPYLRGLSSGEVRIKIRRCATIARRQMRIRHKVALLRRSARALRRMVSSRETRHAVLGVAQILLWLIPQSALRVLSRLRGHRPIDPRLRTPQIARVDVHEHNIVYFCGTYFGVSWSQGTFDQTLAESEQACRYFRGHSIQVVEAKIIEWVDSQPWNWRQVRVLRLTARLLGRLLRRLVPASVLDRMKGRRAFDANSHLPQLVREGFRDHNIIYFRGTFFGVHRSLGPFDPALIRSERECPYWRGQSMVEVQSRVIEWISSLPPEPWSWRQVALLRLVARTIRVFLPARLVDMMRRRKDRAQPFDHEIAVAGLICASEIEAERKAA